MNRTTIFFIICFGVMHSCSAKQDSYKEFSHELVNIWNDAINKKEIETLCKMYDSVVHHYQWMLSRDECANKVKSFFSNNPDYKQSIEGNLFFDTIRENLIRINFSKKVNDEVIPAYLIFKQQSDGWKIFAESDIYTDRLLQSAAQIPPNAIEGDYNGDGIIDYMWLETDKNETCKIRFSGPIPPIILDNCFDGIPVNQGDLNDDGIDEVGILPIGKSDCWKTYFVYTFHDNQWIYMVEPIPTHCEQWEKEILQISKDRKKGYVIINYSKLINNRIEIKTKSEKLQLLNE